MAPVKAGAPGTTRKLPLGDSAQKRHPPAHKLYEWMLCNMVGPEEAQAIEAIVAEVCKTYSLDPSKDLSDVMFIKGVTYRLVTRLALLAQERGLTDFWRGSQNKVTPKENQND